MLTGSRIARWVLGVLASVVTVWALYEFADPFTVTGDSLEVNEILLSALSIALVVIALALAGIIIRNLVRLIVDRKRGILGSKLRTKLVFFFLGLVLLPAGVLFYGSASVIKTTVEALLRAPLEELTRQSAEMVDQWSEYFRNQSLRVAEGLTAEIQAGDYLRPERESDLDALVARWQQLYELEIVRVGTAAGTLAEARKPGGAQADVLESVIDRLLDGLIKAVASGADPVTRINRLGDGLLIQSAIPLKSLPGEPQSVVAVGQVLPTRLTGNLEGLAEASQTYRQFRLRRQALIRLYLTQIALVFLVTVFIATWIGFYLSRRITVPLQELATAAREISVGNLQVRVDAKVGDEVGVLVDAFNEMAGELEENRAVITRSTSDLRESNRALDIRRRYIETLLANLTTAVLSLDPDGKLTTANPAVRRLLNVDLLPGDDLLEVFKRQSLLPVGELLALGIKRGGEGLQRDLTLRTGGATHHVSAQVTELKGGDGEAVGTLLMLEDLTDLIRAQRSAAWREVAQRIAHEIKNPLTPIQLAAQRLGKKFKTNPADLEHVLPEATAAIEREVGTLKRLVDEFSRYARMPEISQRQVEFNSIVASVRSLYEGLPGIDWTFDLDPAIKDVTLDPEQIRRVFINLIDNAIAALDGRGSIRIEARRVNATTMRIEVLDDGPGIKPGDMDKMFVPYFSTKKRGTGLGLTIVDRIITDHHGSIWVENNVPSGARFIIEIPV
jgi:two-component system nitrogen regulation sensor histidine kinase NtrY